MQDNEVKFPSQVAETYMATIEKHKLDFESKKHERMIVAVLIVITFVVFLITVCFRENYADLVMNAALALIGYFAGSGRNQ